MAAEKCRSSALSGANADREARPRTGERPAERSAKQSRGDEGEVPARLRARGHAPGPLLVSAPPVDEVHDELVEAHAEDLHLHVEVGVKLERVGQGARRSAKRHETTAKRAQANHDHAVLLGHIEIRCSSPVGEDEAIASRVEILVYVLGKKGKAAAQHVGMNRCAECGDGAAVDECDRMEGVEGEERAQRGRASW